MCGCAGVHVVDGGKCSSAVKCVNVHAVATALGTGICGSADVLACKWCACGGKCGSAADRVKVHADVHALDLVNMVVRMC